MDISKLKYFKESPNQKQAVTASAVSRDVINSDAFMPTLKPASGYYKSDGELSTSLVFVLSGGEKREYDFLKVLIKGNEFHSVRVAFHSQKGQGLQPYQMQQKWHEISTSKIVCIEGQEYQLEKMDKIYLLSDVDEFYVQLKKILSEQVANECWIISNPCFEMWLYYCYLNNPETDLAELKNLSIEQRSKKLKGKGQQLVCGGFNPIKAFEQMQTGIKNSRAHYIEDEYKIPKLFATQMFVMASEILLIMQQHNDEFNKLLQRKREQRIRFKQLNSK